MLPRQQRTGVPSTSARLRVAVLLVALSMATVSCTTTPAHSPHHSAAEVPASQEGVVRTSLSSGNWSDASLWGGVTPQPGDAVAIAAGHTITVDQTTTELAGVTVNDGGTLRFDPLTSAMLSTRKNVVVSGTLAMKPSTAAVEHTLQFVDVDESKYVGGGMEPIESDVGLWVMGNGVLDTLGVDKTDWTRLAGSVDQGATTATLETAPTGWQPGDEISIAPTEAPSAGSAFFEGFDEADITQMSGATVTLSRATSRSHPLVNGQWKAEVMNLTRNVKIEGTQAGRAHIFIHSTQPQSIKNTEIRYMGPRQWEGETWSTAGVETKITASVKGRYSLHFHHTEDGSRGSVVAGTSVHDGGSHSFVAHRSHGIIFDSDVSYDTLDDAYWWDSGAEGSDGQELRYPADPVNYTHDTLYQNSIAAKIQDMPNERGYSLTGFSLDSGLRNIMRGCVAVGVQGAHTANGINWPETNGVDVDPQYPSNEGANSWVFEDNVTHNNKRHGAGSWQVDSTDHVVHELVSYHNGGAGFRWGAYANRYHFVGNDYYGNAETQFLAWGFSASPDEQPYDGFQLVDSRLDAAGQSDFALTVFSRSVVESNPNHVGGIYLNNTFAGYRKAAVNWQFEHTFGDLTNPDGTAMVGWSNNSLFVNNSWANPDQSKDFYVDDSKGMPAHELSALRVIDGRHGDVTLRRSDLTGVLNPAWNASVTVNPAAGDFVPPLLSMTWPGFGDAALAGGFAIHGVTTIAANAADDVAVTRVDFLVDDALACTDTMTPYACDWDTSGLLDGSQHSITVRAYDASGQVALQDNNVVIGSSPTG